MILPLFVHRKLILSQFFSPMEHAKDTLLTSNKRKIAFPENQEENNSFNAFYVTAATTWKQIQQCELKLFSLLQGWLVLWRELRLRVLLQQQSNNGLRNFGESKALGISNDWFDPKNSERITGCAQEIVQISRQICFKKQPINNLKSRRSKVDAKFTLSSSFLETTRCSNKKRR